MLLSVLYEDIWLIMCCLVCNRGSLVYWCVVWCVIEDHWFIMHVLLGAL